MAGPGEARRWPQPGPHRIDSGDPELAATDMPIARLARLSIVAFVSALAAALGPLTPPSAARAAPPLATAIYDPQTFSGDQSDLAFARTKQAGASLVDIQIYWAAVAPRMPPAGFRADDPGDPAYDWSVIDRQVSGAVAHGLTPILSITSSPRWAQGDPTRPNYDPDPSQYGLFARAAALRYGGTFGGLPRVRYWQAWNEPNLDGFLLPQSVGGRNTSVDLYRRLLDAFVTGVKGVYQDNLVIAGSMGPFGSQTSTPPLTFMQALLCVTAGPHPQRTCQTPVSFDIWAHHPYTTGGPTHRASLPGDVSLGDLPTMRAVLTAADRLGQIRHSSPLQFWVTEFGWDSNPPNKDAAPAGLLARWVPEALYRMWRAGVTMATWFLLRDEVPAGQPMSGLYLRGPGGLETDKPKPELTGFRFPFVAFPAGARVLVWGRIPPGDSRSVMVQQSVGSSWRTAARLHADRNGIFTAHVRRSGGGSFRARTSGGDVSLPFPLTPTPDIPYPAFV